ncbi:MAG: YihY/virulence factor BrkB family protein, partial [Bacteroidia bacterium]
RSYRRHEYMPAADDAVEPVLEKTRAVRTDHPFLTYLKSKTFKGFQGHSLFDVGRYFLRSLFTENLNMRASALSFNFFLALFPALIFTLTLIAYLPFDDLKTQFVQELSRVLPDKSYKEVASTIQEILLKQNRGLLSFGFALTLYFASNAFHILINNFNRRLPIKVKKNWFQVRLKALFMTGLISSMVIVVLVFITWGYQLHRYMVHEQWRIGFIYEFILVVLEYAMIASLIFLAISSIYFFGPHHQWRWKFFSAGSILAASLSILSSLVFSFYVNNFDSYNKIYGSIGAIIALLILIYINVLAIIVGFELNASIEKAGLDNAENEA